MYNYVQKALLFIASKKFFFVDEKIIGMFSIIIFVTIDENSVTLKFKLVI